MAKFKKTKATAKKIYHRAKGGYKKHGHLFHGAMGAVVSIALLKIVSQFLFKHKDAAGKEVGFLPFGETLVMRYGLLWAINKFLLQKYLKTPAIVNTVLEVKFADAIVSEWGGKMIPALALSGEADMSAYSGADDVYFDEATGQVVTMSGEEVPTTINSQYV